MASTSDVAETEGDIDTESNTLRLENVTKTFGGGSIIACKNINLEINPDEFVVFLGPSGCGKTTTLRCIAGLEDPDSGTIMAGDRDITHEKPKDRDLAFVFQTITLFPHMDVRKNMRFGLDMTTDLTDEDKNERVEQAAELLGISELLDRNPSELSGGQQQRVSLGRAMVMEPIAFLLDEPFSALDANLRDQMQTEIKRLHRELERAMIFVTHDQEEAMTVGDKIVVMDDAEIQQVGTPHEVYNEPANLLVANFIGSPSTNTFTGTVEENDGEVELTSDLFSVSLDDDRSETLREYVGETVTIGIRPEHLNLVDSEGPADFTADVELVEPQGARDTIFLEAGGGEIRATTEQGVIKEGASDTTVSIDRERIWVFDGSGDRIV